MVLDQGSSITQAAMGKLYRIMVVMLILSGILVSLWAVKAAWDSVTVVRSPHAIHCSETGCRSILDDGSLSDDSVDRPKGPRR